MVKTQKNKNDLKQRLQTSIKELNVLAQLVSWPRPLDGPVQATMLSSNVWAQVSTHDPILNNSSLYDAVQVPQFIFLIVFKLHYINSHCQRNACSISDKQSLV